MPIIYKLLPSFLVLIALLASTGCNANSDGQEVNSVRFLAGDITIGESVRVEIDFTVDREFFGDVEATTLTFQISSALALQPGSFYIYEDDDDSDSITPQQVIRCPDGRTLAQVYLTRSDLRPGAFSEDENELKFNVIGKEVREVAVVQAAAGQNDDLSCGNDFQSQAEATVTVSPLIEQQ